MEIIRRHQKYLMGNYAGIGWDSADLQAIMRLPEVVSTEAESISDEEHAALVAATEAAVA